MEKFFDAILIWIIFYLFLYFLFIWDYLNKPKKQYVTERVWKKHTHTHMYIFFN